jgi:peptidoglycan hydrolase CwlO-like protein
LRSELAKEQAKVQEAEKKADDLQNKSNDWQGKYEKLKEKLVGLMNGV